MGVITSSGNTVIQSGNVTAAMTGAVDATIDYSNFVTVARNISSGTLVSTVPVGKKWIITGYKACENGASTIDASTCQNLSYEATAGNTSASAGIFVLAAGGTITITRTAYFTYVELDA